MGPGLTSKARIETRMGRCPGLGSALAFLALQIESGAGMLKRLKDRLSWTATPVFPPLAPEEDFIAVGDIHGRYDLMLRLMERLADRPHFSRLVFLGDYIDRGEESRQALEALHWIQKNTEDVLCLRGNHEDMLLNFLEDPIGLGPVWLQHGGRQTLASYGIVPIYPDAPKEDWVAARDRLRGKMGDGLIGWIRALPTLWQTGNVVLVHAGADPSRPMGAQDEQDLIWGHRDFLRLPRRDGLWVIHGHTIVEKVSAYQGRIGTDTGAFATGRLSAVSVTTGAFEILETRK